MFAVLWAVASNFDVYLFDEICILLMPQEAYIEGRPRISRESQILRFAQKDNAKTAQNDNERMSVTPVRHIQTSSSLAVFDC